MTYEEFCRLSDDEQEQAVREADGYEEHDRLLEMLVRVGCVPRKSKEDILRDRVLRIVRCYELEEMRGMTDKELLRMPNFGKKALRKFRSMYPPKNIVPIFNGEDFSPLCWQGG